MFQQIKSAPAPRGAFRRVSALRLLLLFLTISMPLTAQAAEPRVPTDHPLQVGFLVVDGVFNSELVAPYDILHHTVFHTQPGMELFVVSPSGEPVTTFEGLTIEAHYGFEDAPPIDILVVPSAEHSMDSDLENSELIDWVREVGGKALHVMSLCDGAFVLAKAGLLDDVVSTTFPGDVDHYEEMFPDLDVRRDLSFVHDGQMLTSQGGARSYDVAIYLVSYLYGDEVAVGVGRGMVIPWPPAPGTMPHLVVDAEGRGQP